MDIVVLDTCVLMKSPRLRSPAFQALIEHRDDWSVRLVVPQVVLMETVNAVRRDWAARRKTMSELKVHDFDLGEQQEAMLARIDEHAEDYERWLSNRLEEIGAIVAPIPAVDHAELVQRSMERRAPYAKSDKRDSLRDTLIWLTVLDVAEAYRGSAVWFVSDNTADFGPKPTKAPKWTSEPGGTRDSCPILFDQELTQELEDRGLSGRVEYVASVERLQQHLAAQHSPIDEDELAALTNKIGLDVLAAELAEMARGFDLDPEQIALKPGAFAARIGKIEHLDQISYYDGARRGGQMWTARFKAEVVVGVIFFHPEYTGTVYEDKRLRLFGDITAGRSFRALVLHRVEDVVPETLPKDSILGAIAQVLLGTLTPEKLTEVAQHLRAEGRHADLAVLFEMLPAERFPQDLLRELSAPDEADPRKSPPPDATG